MELVQTEKERTRACAPRSRKKVTRALLAEVALPSN
jgi:hypothetical protein